MICTYERTIYENGTNGYRIVSYITDDESVPENARNKYYPERDIRFTAVGYHLPVTNAVGVDLKGRWETSRYGMQYAVSSFVEITPTSKDGIINYLSSGLIKGIGPKTAKIIVDKFGGDTFEIIENSPEKLLGISGVTKNKLNDIIESYNRNRSFREIMTVLTPFGVSAAKAVKIYETFGTGALSILKNNPFRLCEISGFGFKTVDEIAKKTGCNPGDPLRIRGAVTYALDAGAVEGHLYLDSGDLYKRAGKLLNEGLDGEAVSLEDIRRESDIMYAGFRIIYKGDKVYKAANYYAESNAAEHIADFIRYKSKKPDISSELKKAQAVLNLTLSPKQTEAVKMCFENNISIVTGGPGTGKTTILRVILEIYKTIRNGRENVLLAAPTGRASRRMSESTGYPASTLHSALGLITDDDDGDYMNSDEWLEYDFVIVDEVSMVDMRLAGELFGRIRAGTRILLVGDAGQLPSVGAGSVFRELINCGLIPVTVLDVVFRQSHTSRIVLNAQYIRENKTNLLYGDDFEFINCETEEQAAGIIKDLYMREIKTAGTDNVQILSPFKKRGGACVKVLNETIRELVNPKSPVNTELKAGFRTFRVKDKVVQIKNKNGISNGDMGTVVEIYDGHGSGSYAKIEFSDERVAEYGIEDLNMVEHAYAVTIHKSQGSEYDVVIIPMLYKPFFIMLKRNLIYTAVTRAKKKVILVGQKQAVAVAIKTNDIDKRNTALAERIKQSYNELPEKTA